MPVDVAVAFNPLGIQAGQHAVGSHGLVQLAGGLIQLGQDLVQAALLGAQLDGQFKGAGGILQVGKPGAVDLAQVLVEHELQVLVALVPDPGEHPAVGFFKARPVLLTGQDLVQGLEGLQLVRVQIQGALVVFQGRQRVVQVLFVDGGDGEGVVGLLLAVVVDLVQAPQGVHGVLVLLALDVNLQQLDQRSAGIRLDAQGVAVAVRRVPGLAKAVLVKVANLQQTIEPREAVVRQFQQLALVADDALEVTVEFHEGGQVLDAALVVGTQADDLGQVLLGLGGLAQGHLNLAQGPVGGHLVMV